MLKLVRDEINLYLNKYESCDGKSPDYYCTDNKLHPMAIAKYLLTLSSLYRSKLLNKYHLINKIQKPISQLQDLKILSNNKYIFYGLNFNYKNFSEKEKYLITTAIVTQSLCELSLLIDDKKVKELSSSCLLSLEYWLLNNRITCEHFKNGVPAYSDNNTNIIYNAAAYAYSVAIQYSTNETIKEHATKFILELMSVQIPGVGWTYSPNNSTIDLLHICYIAEAFLSFPQLLNNKSIFNILSMINQFNNGTDFLDSCILKEDIAEWTGGAFRYIDKSYFIEFKSSKARMWSMGELLVLLSLIMKFRENNNIKSFSRKILLVALEMSYKEKNYVRHTMHYTHGLASLLEAIRKK